MSILNDLSDCLTDTVTYRALVSRDQYAVPTYGTGVVYSARVVRKHRLVRDSQGDEVVSTAHAWIASLTSADPDDQIELSDGTTPDIAAVETFPDENGAVHVKVFFR